MPAVKSDAEILRTILEQIQNPESLDSHPWVSRLFAQEAKDDSNPQNAGAGRRLLGAIESMFSKMRPAAPPRRGKRLDTRWGEFGILAARYFAPLRFGTPIPSSLRDAWGRIDEAILLFVFGRSVDSLDADQIAIYKVVGDEPEVTANSTLSDWLRNGLQRLADQLDVRDRYLANQSGELAAPKDSGGHDDKLRGTLKQRIIPILLILVLAIIVLGGIQAWRVYRQALRVQQDAFALKSLMSSSANLEQIKQAGPALETLQQDFGILKNEVQPFLWIGGGLRWVPTYGNDLASAQDLVTLADSMINSATDADQALQPLVDGISASQSGFTISKATNLLIQNQAGLLKAQNEFSLASEARRRVNPENLSPRLRGIILNDVDPLMTLMQDGLTLGVELPRLVGATDDGPKTYLLLAQNSDELRPTGGFITAAGTLLLQDGRISNMTFQNSGEFEDWTRPYPTAPWQLSEYMGSAVLIFRDANWFTNYPQAALYAEDLYSYSSGHSVNGVIAFDQQFLVNLLKAVGPIQVECSSDPIDFNNLMSFMRETKFTPSDQALSCWKKDTYLSELTHALLDKILGGDVPYKQLAQAVFQSLNERHLLVKVDDPILASLLASRGWDGVVRSGNGDFLMVVDSNVGYNKTNAVVATTISYDVDLANLSAPVGRLTVMHQNNAARDIPCKPFPYLGVSDTGATYWEEYYPIDRCYWDYLRVYTPAGTQLLQATPQSIPGEWMILKQPVAPKVDVLDEEIPGVQGFGTLKIVPGGQFVKTSFQFALPATILKSRGTTSQVDYHLRIQKQPGTLTTPISITIHLPETAVIQTIPTRGVAQGHNILIQTDLSQDVELDVVFTVP